MHCPSYRKLFDTVVPLVSGHFPKEKPYEGEDGAGGIRPRYGGALGLGDLDDVDCDATGTSEESKARRLETLMAAKH